MKILKYLLLILIVAYGAGFFLKKELKTEVEIAASPDIVWKHLTDFKSYPEWNKFVTKVDGEASKGSQLTVTIAPDGKAMDFKPTLVTVEKDKELRWQGRMAAPGLFDGDHYFQISASGEGKTKLVHGEKFRGILVYPLMAVIGDSTKSGFEAMNNGLKERAEAEVQAIAAAKAAEKAAAKAKAEAEAAEKAKAQAEAAEKAKAQEAENSTESTSDENAPKE